MQYVYAKLSVLVNWKAVHYANQKNKCIYSSSCSLCSRPAWAIY